MALEIYQYPYGPGANYGVLLHDPGSGETAAVDAGDYDALMSSLTKTGWSLSEIWITHHHADHIAGLESAKSATGARVIGPDTIDARNATMAGGDAFEFSGHRIEVLHTPGHTLDMLNYYLPDEGLVFTGDTLFVMGCGRVFEGDFAMMHESLQKLAALPPETVVYCSHEYTEANTDFALTVDPENQALIARAEHIRTLRADGKPTVPTTIARELETNPFLRAHTPGVREAVGLPSASDAEVFAEVRRRKDAA